MSNDHGDVLLVGSVARPSDGWTVEDVFANCARGLGGFVSMLPDGELGDRYLWITWLPKQAYARHPDVVTLSRHTAEDWIPRGYGDHWRIAVKEGVQELQFERIGYAAEAKSSYGVFRRLRDEGTIPEAVRFLVALPLSESATRPFIETPRDFEILWQGYRDVIAREIDEITGSIPHEDLAIQWDLARETAAVEGVEFQFADSELRTLPSDPMERYCHALSELSPRIPADVWLGLHVCYGSLGHEEGESPDSAHYVPIRDLGTAVQMLNRGTVACGRRVDYVHMPVQFDPAAITDEFYAPLERLEVGDARVYIGLIDPWDGVEGALKRIEVAKRHLSSFGVATACGWGRRPPNETPDSLIALEREVLEARTCRRS